MLINYFLFLVMLLLFAGLALDTGMMQWRALRLQQAADGTAQEAMYEKARNNSSWAAAGQAEATQNGFTNGSNGVTVTIANPPTSGPFIGNSWAVQAKVTQTFNNLFMGLIHPGSSSITGTATAQIMPTCIWIMNTNGVNSNGSLWLLSTQMLSNCGVYVDTTTGYSLAVDYFARLSAPRIRVVGPASSGAISSGSISSTPKYSAANKNDPLAYVTAPTVSSCTYNAVNYSSGTHTLSPGTYCGGITLSKTTIFLDPGLYIIAGGMNLWDTNMTGTGVTLYFTKTSASPSYANVVINSDNTSGLYGVYLKAPTTSANGCIPGVVVFADRNWVTHNSQGVQITNNKIISDGFWYLPNTGLSMWIVQFGYYKYNGLVIDNIYQYSDGSYFNSDYSDLGGVSPLHYEDGVLVQ